MKSTRIKRISIHPRTRIQIGPITALICPMALVGLLLWSPALQAAITRPAPKFAVPLKSGYLSALQSEYSAVANVVGDIDLQSDARTLAVFDHESSISHAGSVAASAADVGHPEISAFAEFQGLTKVGKLSAMTHAWVEKGVGGGLAVMQTQFMDVVQVDTAGSFRLSWVVSGTADEQILFPFSNEAGSGLTAELFIWPYGTFPTTGLPFVFTDYARTVATAAGTTHLLPGVFSAAKGNRFWVLGQLNIESRARSTSLLRLLPPYKVETTADFGHTVELFITPDPSTPQAAFHSASGHDYRATSAVVPEASSWSLLMAGLLVLRLRRRNGRSARKSR